MLAASTEGPTSKSKTWPPRWLRNGSEGRSASVELLPESRASDPAISTQQREELCQRPASSGSGHKPSRLVKRLQHALRPKAKSTPVVPLAKQACSPLARSCDEDPRFGGSSPVRPPLLPGGASSPQRHQQCHEYGTLDERNISPCGHPACSRGGVCCCGSSCASTSGSRRFGVPHDESYMTMESTPSCSSYARGTTSQSNTSTPRASPDVHFAPTRFDGCGGREIFSLYASPLDHPPINVRSEIEMLQMALADSQSSFRLNVGVATASSLTKILTLARARKGLVLHLSAHAEEGGLGLVLEDGKGQAHLLQRQSLEEILGIRERGLRNVSLLFLSCCWSEELAQVFVECGCRHVVAVRTRVPDSVARHFAEKFYLALGVGEPLLAAWEGARQALRISSEPGFAQNADNFVLFGQHGAERATLDSLCGAEEHSLDVNPLLRDLEDASVFLDVKVPPMTENFVGRTQMMKEMLHAYGGFHGRRACAAYGPAGVGKSAFGVELAYFASAPGRLFSCSVRILQIESFDLTEILNTVEEELENYAAYMRVPLRPQSAGSHHSTPSLKSEQSEGSQHSTPASGRRSFADDPLVGLLAQRQRIKRGFQQIERVRHGQRILFIFDDSVGAVGSSNDLQRLLGELLEHTHQLSLLILSRDPVYASLGTTKVVNVPLRGLNDPETARLFLLRTHRPLQAADLAPRADSPSGSTAPPLARAVTLPTRLDDAARLLCGPPMHPLLARLNGNPRSIRMVGARVTPGGPSLNELAALDNILG